MKPSARRVAQQWVLSKRDLDLRGHGLEGMQDGSPVTLYHGTTRSFKTFDISKSREYLVKDYYGGGIFLTPEKKVAWKYALANRNMGIDPSIIRDLKRVNPPAGAFLKNLYEQGEDAWDSIYKTLSQHEQGPAVALDEMFGFDGNLLDDLAGYIIGSKVKPLGSGGPLNIFSQGTGAPDWLYDTIDEIGLDGDKYRPKVYTVVVSGIHNPLITTSLSQARKAKSKGHDAVIYHGREAVGGVPEVAVFNPRNTKITKVEV